MADFSFAQAEVARLDEARLAAVEDLVEADLACGRHAAVTSELDGLVATHPLRERLCGQRMLALYRCGRQAEALAAYTELRGRLADELGIDPNPALHRLQEAILRQEPGLDWTAPQERVPQEPVPQEPVRHESVPQGSGPQEPGPQEPGPPDGTAQPGAVQAGSRLPGRDDVLHRA